MTTGTWQSTGNKVLVCYVAREGASGAQEVGTYIFLYIFVASGVQRSPSPCAGIDMSLSFLLTTYVRSKERSSFGYNFPCTKTKPSTHQTFLMQLAGTYKREF